jgi:holo-[acyl-carrier protein] synthase
MNNKLLKSISELAIDQKFAVGNDFVFLPDFTASFNELFKKKIYTPEEIAYCDQFDDAMLRYASTWAAKEAVYKAIKQIDPAAFPFKKIEILREKPQGRPHVILHKNPNKFNISLTISHDGDYIWALAFIEINPKTN